MQILSCRRNLPTVPVAIGFAGFSNVNATEHKKSNYAVSDWQETFPDTDRTLVGKKEADREQQYSKLLGVHFSIC